MKKFIRSGFAIAVTLLLIMSFSACKVENTKEKEAFELKFQHTAQDREVGHTQSMITYEENYAYGIHYPSIGVESIDAAIKAAAQEMADLFVNEVRQLSGKGELPNMTADYRSYLVSNAGENKYVSVVFEIKTDIPEKEIRTDCIKTMLFDIESGKQVSDKEFFSENYLKLVGQKVTEYFTANRLFSSETGTEKFKKGVSAQTGNFTRFSLDSENITFYFDAGELFGYEKGCAEAVFAYKDISGIFTGGALNILYGSAGVQMSEESQKPSSVETTKSQRPSLPAGVKYIAFTFDDGPSKTVTNRILDTLQKYNGKATFFVLGTRVGSYSAEVKRAYSMGCEIGSHSWSHANLRKISAAERKQEINKTNDIIKDVIGVEPTLFRVPYGDYKGIQQDFDQPLIQWSIDTNDWKYKDRQGSGRTEAQRNADMQKIIDSVVNHATGGEIVLMHDLYDMTADAFEVIAAELYEEDFKFVTVHELYNIYGQTLEPGKVYFSPKR